MKNRGKIGNKIIIKYNRVGYIIAHVTAGTYLTEKRNITFFKKNRKNQV